MSHVEVKDEQIEDQQPNEEALADEALDDPDDNFEEDELTSDERPPRAPCPSPEDAVARRRSAPTSFELPPQRAFKSLADELEPEDPPGNVEERRIAPTAPQTRTRRTLDADKNRPTAPQPMAPRPLDPESLGEPAGDAQDWLAVAPTKRAVPEDFTGPEHPVVVTTDAAGKLTIAPGAAGQQPPDRHTLKISAEEAPLLREAKEQADSAKKKLSKPTAPMPPAAQARRLAESVDVTPAPIMPRRPSSTPPPPALPRIGDSSVDDDEPTRHDEVTGAPPTPDEVQLGPEQSAETVIGDAVPTPAPMPAAPGLDSAQEFVEEEPTALDDQGDDPPLDEPTVREDEPPSPAVQQPPDKGDVSSVRLSTMEMMGRLSAMGAPLDSQPVAKVADDPAPPVKEQPQAAPLKKSGTAPGFQSTGELVTPQAHDPLRFLRTTRRYASVEIPPDELRDDQTEIQTLDPGLVSSVMRMDASSQEEPKRSSKGYAAIRREVRQEGRRQDDRGDLGTAEVEDAVEDLRDTIRDIPGEVGSLDGAGVQPRTPFPLFSDLDTAAFLAMVDKLERREFDAGSLIFQEGDPGDSLFLVSAGILQVLKQDEEERQNRAGQVERRLLLRRVWVAHRPSPARLRALPG